MIAAILIAALLAAAPAQGGSSEHRFTLPSAGEAVATITAGCERCDWGVEGREAVLVRVLVNGTYIQHLLVSRGEQPAPYRILLGPLGPGDHRLTLERDDARSAPGAGALKIERVEVAGYAEGTPEYEWLAYAPFVHARPGTVERFNDLPILAWAERAAWPAKGFHYSVIFTHEDGGTPTDRLMATWGRTTDIEFLYGREQNAYGARREEMQTRGHEILPFRGPRLGGHPLLWVYTDNNMVTDSGPIDAVRFGLAPELVSLEHTSREAVMDRHPWTYAVMAAELRREGRIDPAAAPGSAKIPDPRGFAYLEGCAETDRAVFALEVATTGADNVTAWHPTDRGEPKFRIARSGCFRAAVPLPPGTTVDRITGVRLRAYTRPPAQGEAALPPGTGRVTLQRFNGLFMLDEQYRPGTPRLASDRPLTARGEGDAVPVAVPPSSARNH
ncbi:MAG TPA: hypothetical protein VM364_02770 [Vicinamibacterales bacterium]|nr:hypothetical protein [Vicinamibacterales bacterium]